MFHKEHWWKKRGKGKNVDFFFSFSKSVFGGSALALGPYFAAKWAKFLSLFLSRKFREIS